MDGLRFRLPARALAAGSLMSAVACAVCAAQPLVRPAWTSSPPLINGDVTAAVWKNATPIRIPGEDSTEVLLLEDARYLYVGVRAAQHEPVAAHGGDEVEIAFAGANNSVDFRVDPLGTSDVEHPGCSSVGRILPGGYEITMRIPRPLLGATAGSSVTIGRRIAAADTSRHSQPLAFADAAGAYTPAQPAKVVAGKAGRFSGAYQSLWPSSNAPLVPGSAAGVAVKRSDGNVTVAALDAHDGSREDDAQSVAYTSPDNRVSTTVQRVQSSQNDLQDVTQSVAVQYDNGSNLRVAGGVASDRASTTEGDSAGSYTFTRVHYNDGKSAADFSWSNAGPQYNPQDETAASAGTNGFTTHVSRKIGDLTLQGTADSYRDDAGSLVSADQQASISVPVGSHLSAALTSGSSYSPAIGAFSENGLHFSYAGALAHGGVDYHTGTYQDGFLQDAGLSAGFQLPVLGEVGVQSRRRNFWSLGFPATTQLLDAVRFSHSMGDAGSFSLSYRNVTGSLPWFLAGELAGSGVSFSVDRYVGIGLLHFSYNETGALSSAHSFSLKIVPGAKP